MVDAGFVDWVRRESGPLLPALMACRDPADAAQKRINRLIKDYTGSADLSWVYHALRHGKIDNDRDNQVDTRLIMKTVGHESGDIHNGYGRLRQSRCAPSLQPPRLRASIGACSALLISKRFPKRSHGGADPRSEELTDIEVSSGRYPANARNGAAYGPAGFGRGSAIADADLVQYRGDIPPVLAR